MAGLARYIFALWIAASFCTVALGQTTDSASAHTEIQTNAQPNIVFIMADDLGPGWVDYDGSNPDINTPNLQRLAESGMIFSKAYAAAPVCSPTRAACITGRSPATVA